MGGEDTLPTGTVVGEKYRVERLLGAGGMGAVYEATNTWTERRVALKLLHRELSQQGELAARFYREARVATKLAHPNIVEILDMGRDATTGALFLVQELLAGGDLRRLLEQRGRLGLREAYEVLVPVMSALMAAQGHGVVHRDLKPENIFLAQRAGEHALVPKVIDFGIAKLASEGVDKGLTKTGAAMGTPFYMSPEQARGAKDIDAQTDIWALGVIWHEVLTGVCPYEADNYNALLAKILTEPVPSVGSRGVPLPQGLVAAIDRALDKRREERWATVADFLRCVLSVPELQGEGYLRGLRERFGPKEGADSTAGWSALGASAPGTPAPAVGARASNTTFGHAATELAATGGRRSGLLAGTVAAGVAVLGLAVFGAVRLAAREDPRPVVVARPGSAVFSASAMASATSAASEGAAPRFLVRVAVSPSSARLRIDGDEVEGNMLVRAFPRDGTEHRLEIRAEGYEGRVVSFADAPPPEEIELEPSSAIQGRRENRGLGPSTAPQVPSRRTSRESNRVADDAANRALDALRESAARAAGENLPGQYIKGWKAPTQAAPARTRSE